MREGDVSDRFSYFFTCSVVTDVDAIDSPFGNKRLSDWKQYETGGEAEGAAEAMAADYQGVAVVATDWLGDDTIFTPIRIIGDVPGKLLWFLMAP
jgi:hypothetical protein